MSIKSIILSTSLILVLSSQNNRIQAVDYTPEGTHEDSIMGEEQSRNDMAALLSSDQEETSMPSQKEPFMGMPPSMAEEEALTDQQALEQAEIALATPLENDILAEELTNKDGFSPSETSMEKVQEAMGKITPSIDSNAADID